MLPRALNDLVSLLGRLPGIGERTATRLAFRILNDDPTFARALGKSLSEIHESIVTCDVCGYFDEVSPCSICGDPRRDERMLCVVAGIQDVIALERSGEFRGRYHVLHKLLAPLDGVGPDDLPLSALERRLESVEEVVVATPLSVEGEATAHLLAQRLRGWGNQREREIRITRIASGMPHGGELEYTDQVTLSRAFGGRQPI